VNSSNEFQNFIYKSQSTVFSKCFFPTKPECLKQAIKAHSIQNRGVLGELCENNHVVTLSPIQDLKNGPRLEFQQVGRNKATTFTGLCNEHDTHLFLPIDSNPFDISNEEHLFLLAYRSILRELHAQCLTSIKIQNAYIKGIELGHFDEKSIDQPMMSATVGFIETYEFFKYFCFWSEAYLSQKFDRIQHRVITIPNAKAKFAVSSVYSLTKNVTVSQNKEIQKCIAFNIFPHEGSVVAIWSCPDFHYDHFSSHLEEFSQAEGEYRKYILSKLVLRYCENFILAPSFYDSLSENKIESIKKYYFANVPVGKVDYDDKNLFLF
jgi:hypothetical protein